MLTKKSQTVCLIAYRLFLHPLSEYPGPFLAKITDLHSTYYAWAGTRHLDLLKQHDKYGNYLLPFIPVTFHFCSN